MKKLCLLITACLFLLVGCDMNADPLAYQNGSVFAEVEFIIGERTYEASVSLSAVREDGGRDAELVFSSPNELSGVCVKRNAVGSFLILDDIEIPLPSASLSGSRASGRRLQIWL